MELWCVTAFFAPFESELRYRNFAIFAQSMLDAGVNLLTVELLYPWTTRRLPRLGQIVTLEAADVLWHKEAMINHGFSLLPESCDIAMFMDCDLIFEDTSWVERLQERMKQFDVIQCFQTCHLLPEGHVSKNDSSIHSFDSIVYHQAKHPEKELSLGMFPGGSWAFKAPHFRNNPLYDRAPFGIIDRIFADCMLGTLDKSMHMEMLTPAHQEDVLLWNQSQLPKKTTYLPVDVLHLWHGDDRNYLHTWDLLKEHDFDPCADLEKRDGVYQWSSQKPELHQLTLEHFLRVEGENPIPTITSITWARNEEDIIESFVRHHVAIVDRMIIILHCCTDRSLEIVRALKEEGLPIEIYERDDLYHAQGEALTDALSLCKDADWIIPLDADEFLSSSMGPVRNQLEILDTNTVYHLPWRTYVPTAQDGIAGDVIHRITHRRAQEPFPFYKVLIPGNKSNNSTLPMGSHQLLDHDGIAMETVVHPALFLAHVPVRSEVQLRKKILQGWESHSRNRPGQNFHWKDLYDRCQDSRPIDTTELQHIAQRYALQGHDTPALVRDPIVSMTTKIG
jgi:hypothetical protein